MGMFDEVVTTCPNCHDSPIVFQSKSGKCVLATYSLDNVPVDVFRGIVGDIVTCPNCGCAVRIASDDEQAVIDGTRYLK